MKHIHQFVGWSKVGESLTLVLSLTARYLELRIEEIEKKNESTDKGQG